MNRLLSLTGRGKSLSVQGIQACELNRKLTCLTQNLNNKKAFQAIEPAGLFRNERKLFTGMKAGFTIINTLIHQHGDPAGAGNDEWQHIEEKECCGIHDTSPPRARLAAKFNMTAPKKPSSRRHSSVRASIERPHHSSASWRLR
ncbi:hypothetical protein [Rhizobium sp. FY34]|uniref:hypothetical protein n=1 Tax=Rhizobium sp. FY34 TaxID=2562309 RepID=UPI00148548B9|nr:hypothetical protein [Rhizobium sp. FY34]